MGGKATTALRFYISSKVLNAKDTLHATRQHWEVENNLHWMLDIAFNEDACQTKEEHAAENLSTLRRIALNTGLTHEYSHSHLEHNPHHLVISSSL